MVSIPIGPHEFVQQQAEIEVKKKKADYPGRILACKPDKRAVMLIASKSRALNTFLLADAMGAKVSELARARAEFGEVWMLEHLMGLPQTADKQTFFDAGCPSEKMQLLSL